MDALHGTAAGSVDARGGPAPAGVPPAADGIQEQFAQVKAAGSAWIALKRDQVALRARHFALYAGLGAGAAATVFAIILVSVFLLLDGLCDLLASGLQLRAGTAAAVVGGAILIALGGAAWIGARGLIRAWGRQMRQRHPPVAGSPP